MATVFCFTSTGNSLYTAQMLAEHIDARVIPMNDKNMQCADDVVGFVFPVYFLGLPHLVERFVTQMHIADKKAYAFAVTTSGGAVFGVLGELKKILLSKGILLSYGAKLTSTTTYIPKHEAHDSEALRRKNDQIILKIAEAIKIRKVNRIPASTFINRISRNSCPNKSSDQYFTIAPTCTGCMICQRICPTGNIRMDEGKPAFLHQCDHCLACLQNCPAQAIDWNQKTQGKARYRNAGVSLDDLISFKSGTA